MNSKQNDGSRWICCPACKCKTRTKVYENAVLINFPPYCKNCKREMQVDVIQFKMVKSN